VQVLERCDTIRKQQFLNALGADGSMRDLYALSEAQTRGLVGHDAWTEIFIGARNMEVSAGRTGRESRQFGFVIDF